MNSEFVFPVSRDTEFGRGRQEGIQQGSREMQLQIARDMLNANMSMQQVAALTKLTLPEVQQLQKARN